MRIHAVKAYKQLLIPFCRPHLHPTQLKMVEKINSTIKSKTISDMPASENVKSDSESDNVSTLPFYQCRGAANDKKIYFFKDSPEFSV